MGRGRSQHGDSQRAIKGPMPLLQSRIQRRDQTECEGGRLKARGRVRRYVSQPNSNTPHTRKAVGMPAVRLATQSSSVTPNKNGESTPAAMRQRRQQEKQGDDQPAGGGEGRACLAVLRRAISQAAWAVTMASATLPISQVAGLSGLSEAKRLSTGEIVPQVRVSAKRGRRWGGVR